MTHTTELVGAGVSSALRRDRRLTRTLTRQVVATALDIDESALDGVDDASMRNALDRLRRMARTIEELAAAAATDELTGVQRRGPGMLALQREIDREGRRPSRGVIVVFLDVDGLKRMNDRRGHAAGDALLRDVVGAIRHRIRSYDLLFRYGGDEFVIVLLDVTVVQAEKVLDAVRQDIRSRAGGSSVSVGVAAVDAEDTAEDVVARADAELYRTRARTRQRSAG